MLNPDNMFDVKPGISDEYGKSTEQFCTFKRLHDCWTVTLQNDDETVKIRLTLDDENSFFSYCWTWWLSIQIETQLSESVLDDLFFFPLHK